MYLALTPEEEAFRDEVRDYFAAVADPAVRDAVDRVEGDRDAYRRFVRRLGEDGWLGISWPESVGGRGLSPTHQFLFFDEAQRQRIPLPFLTTNTVGPTILRHGTDEQRRRFLPAILRGEALFSIGYSEPGAGTDLASLTTRAVREGDEYVITGQKMWTSLIHLADYVWVACRTDPKAPKHRGISILVVPTASEGFSWTPVDTIGGGLTSATFYEGVRVPASNLVGDEHGGWRLMTSQLNEERVALAASGVLERRLVEVTRWAQQTKLADGRRVVDQEWVQVALARTRADVDALRLLNWQVAWEATRGAVEPAAASSMKVFGSERFIACYRALMEIIGSAALISRASPGAVLEAELEEEARRAIILTFGGGTNEIQRDLIATLGLGMPAPPR